jgi:hypothetical protein
MYTDRSRSSSNEGGWSRPFWYRFLQTGMESSFVPVGAGEVGWWSGDEDIALLVLRCVRLYTVRYMRTSPGMHPAVSILF